MKSGIFFAAIGPGINRGLPFGKTFASRLIGKRADIQCFNFLSCPQGSAQELEAGLDRRIRFKAIDIHPLSQSLPTIMLLQLGNHLLKFNTMKWIVGLRGLFFVFFASNDAFTTKYKNVG